MAVLFALVTLIGWGVGDIFVAISSRKIGNLHTYVWGFLFASVITSLYIPFAGPIKDQQMFLLAILLNIIHTIANLSYFRSLEVGNASLAGTVAGSFPIVTVFLAILFFHEALSVGRLAGIILIVFGIILASMNMKFVQTLRMKYIFSDKGIIYALIAAVGWGIYFALVRIPAEKIGWFWAGYPLYLWAFVLLLLPSSRRNILRVFEKRSLVLTVVAYIVLVTIADFAYNIGILAGYTSVVAPIAGAFPVLFVLLTRFVFKEPLTIRQKTGIASALCGIILIGSA